MIHNSFVLFLAQKNIFSTKVAHQSANFKLATARINTHQIPYVIFGTKSQSFFKFRITSQCHEKQPFFTFPSKTLYALDKRSPPKGRFSDFRLSRHIEIN